MMKIYPISLSTIVVLSTILAASCNLPQTGQPIPISLSPGISEADIESILEHSTEIDDPARDWIVTGHEHDNSVIYPVDFGDINNLKIGSDDQTLYIKLTVNGTFPGQGSGFPIIDGDQLIKMNFNMPLDTDNNNQTGCISDGGAEITIGYGIAYENGQIHTNYPSYFTEPTGTETPEQARYLNNLFIDQIQFGGEGHNYFIMTMPLSALKITNGQEITIHAWVEVSSDRYDHASFDPLCPGSLLFDYPSLGCPIKITLGENIIIN
jgi:hypothetical protein